MSEESLSGRTFLVTGASGLLGSALVSTLLGHGGRVLAHHRSPLPDHLKEHPDVSAFEADLQDVHQIRAMATFAEERFGHLDGVINNAASQPVSAFAETSEVEFDGVLDSGLKSVFFLIQSLAPLVADGGCILNIASIEGIAAPPGHAHYGAAKAGVIALTKTAAVEYAPRIRINALLPGLIARSGIEDEWPDGVRRWRERAPLERMGAPEDVAMAALFLLSPAAIWITGVALPVDGGMLARTTW